MKTNHNPGPWTLRDGRNENNALIIVDQYDNVVANCGEYNAPIIKSAPDLLEACIEALRMYERLQPAGGYQYVHDSLLSAITSATGKTLNDILDDSDEIWDVEFEEPILTKEWPESSMIGKTEFDPENESLIVTFKNGKRYLYRGVPMAEWEKLIATTSIGKYLNAQIKGQYPSEAMDEPAKPIMGLRNAPELNDL
jgi:hypothetical protein